MGPRPLQGFSHPNRLGPARQQGPNRLGPGGAAGQLPLPPGQSPPPSPSKGGMTGAPMTGGQPGVGAMQSYGAPVGGRQIGYLGPPQGQGGMVRPPQMPPSYPQNTTPLQQMLAQYGPYGQAPGFGQAQPAMPNPQQQAAQAENDRLRAMAMQQRGLGGY